MSSYKSVFRCKDCNSIKYIWNGYYSPGLYETGTMCNSCGCGEFNVDQEVFLADKFQLFKPSSWFAGEYVKRGDV